ncbi:MAG: 2,3-bisphosphoglycerate-independent phosphoglycerate mutase [Clostridia bacterium]|jgi:2,3-bisphosphoglycerate-independent phosphoglycerate mutase|nr:2,3-bisphosphoglycerate-independent phosphoglycerate mutase [Clostridia bacterium]MCI2013940.1 2,3-bisphosphoglycerate-independent phosphoglycerate mutase [Clostridia bacterium]
MKTTVLMILDGFGLSERTEGNAIKLAKTPVYDGLSKKYPFVKGYASGLDVGLPEGQMGNSEVGHLNIGAGRIVYQELTRITKAIEDGDFFKNEALLKAAENCKKNNSAFHIFGLVSPGGVHSHTNHLYALLKFAKDNGLDKVYVHAFMDGRDTAPDSGKKYMANLESKMREIGVGKVATVSGRYYAMDRDKRWDRVQKAYDAITASKGEKYESADKCIAKSYESGVTDEFIVPAVIKDSNGKTVAVNDNDSVVFFDFRPDRARQITRAFCDDDFSGFKREKRPENIVFVCFTEYDKTIKNKLVAFEQQKIDNTLGEYVSDCGKKQLRIAETEKYAHVTFFFNGGVETPYKNEDRILIPSPKVATYDMKPEMSAFKITEKLIENINAEKYDLIVINYANSDMVGHTGKLDAAVKAVEAVDKCLGEVVEAVVNTGASMFICADHGNSEQMIDYNTGEPFTAHTTNPVPFILVNYTDGIGLRDGGRLADIAPTLLEMMNMKIPKEMTGKSLLVNE